MNSNIKALASFCGNKEYNNFIYPISLINEENLSKNKIFLKLLPINEMAEKLHTTKNKVLNVIAKLLDKSIVLRDLFSYSYFPTGTINEYGVLVATKCASSFTYSRENRGFVENFYDVYLVRNTYFGVAFNLIFKALLAEIFPNMFIENEENHFLFKEDFKYSLEERKCLEKLSKNLTLGNIPHELDQLSIKDVTRCLSNKKRINDIERKSRILSYFDSDCIYIHLFNVNIEGSSYSRELYVPLEALFAKDYEAIANMYIASQAMLDENGKRIFKSCAQKDIPYFKNERTQKILEYILK